MSIKKEVVDRLSMFTPKSNQSLRSDYPELNKNKAFIGLNKNEMFFCWYFACKSSPLIREEDPRKRAEAAIYFSYPKDKRDQIARAYSSGNFPEKLKIAIDEMRKYEPGPRIRAKMMVEKIMQNYEKIISIEIDGNTEFKNKDGEVDWAKKKSYIDTCSVVAKNLSLLISQSEGSFGITEEKDGESYNEYDDGSLIEEFHSIT